MGTPQGGLLDRWRLIGAIVADKRCRAIHPQVAWTILDAYYAKYGNARAAVSYLAQATGRWRGAVAEATADLVEWGYFTREIGNGTRSTTYVPQWVSVLPATDANASVLPVTDEGVLPATDASGVSVLPVTEQTHLLSPAYRRGTDKWEVDSRGGAAHPHRTALGGAGGGDAPRVPEGFERLWSAYPLKVNRAAARREYDRLNPDAALQAKLEAKAAELASHYAAEGTDKDKKKWWKTLPRWLSEERYLEEPRAYVDHKAEAVEAKKKRAPKAAKAPKPRATPPAPVGVAPPDEPAEWRRLRVAATSTSEPRAGVTVARFEFEGGASPIVFPIIHPEPRARDGGREKLATLCHAAGRPKIDDTDDLLGAEIIALVRGDMIERYHYPDQGPAPACVNDLPVAE